MSLTAEQLAAAFVDLLRQQISPGDFQYVREQNVGIDPGFCASHEVCDANMVMYEAFEEQVGRPIYLEDQDSDQFQADAKLWGAAWKIATEKYLTRT